MIGNNKSIKAKNGIKSHVCEVNLVFDQETSIYTH